MMISAPAEAVGTSRCHHPADQHHISNTANSSPAVVIASTAPRRISSSPTVAVIAASHVHPAPAAAMISPAVTHPVVRIRPPGVTVTGHSGSARSGV